MLSGYSVVLHTRHAGEIQLIASKSQIDSSGESIGT